MFFFLVSFLAAADNFPLLIFDPKNSASPYSSYSYRYDIKCPLNLNLTGWQCGCPLESLPYFNASSQNCTENCSIAGFVNLSNICVNSTIFNEEVRKLPQQAEMRYFDVIAGKNGPKTFVKVNPENDLLNDLNQSALRCYFNKEDQNACNFLANMCSVSMYDPNFYACKAFYHIFPNRIGMKNGYFDWPENQPFINYTDTLKNVMRENYVSSSFKNNDIITFVFGQYSQKGEFKGFRELKTDLQKCSVKHNRKQIWRQFGWNFYSECDFNFTFAYDSTDFFDIFFKENYNSSETNTSDSYPVLRPVPILLGNFRNQNERLVNQMGDESQYKLFRRFFLYDNYTSFNRTPYVKQVLSNITIVFTIRSSNKSHINTPYFIMEYTQLLNNSNFLPRFTFNVQYTMEMVQFWDAVLYVFIVFILLILAYWTIHSFLYIKQYSYGGTDMHMILSVVSEFFILTGILFFAMCLAFGLFMLWFYKWTAKIIMCLPPEKELSLFFTVLWLTFGFMTIGVLIKVIVQTDLNFFLIDWEMPHKKKVSISAWRRILVGNEWCKISTVRAYSVSFTLIAMLFILEGFNTMLIATPIPSSELIDFGYTYKILRFSYTAFLWLLLIFFQYIIINFAFWKITGNPFLNFLEICRTAKVSVLLLITNNHGFYIHGKINDIGHADVDIETLNENIDMECTFDETDPSKNYEIYLATEFYHLLREKYYSIKLGIERGEKVKANYETYNSINIFLKQFIEQQDASLYKYEKKDWNLIQMVDMGPAINYDSIFTKAPDEQFKYSMMYGIQGVLMIFYLVMFSCIDVTTYSPEIGAFVVFIIDWIIHYVFKFRARYSLSSKGILDRRFLIG